MPQKRIVVLANGVRLLLVYRGHNLGHEWQQIDAYDRVMANGVRVRDLGQFDGR